MFICCCCRLYFTKQYFWSIRTVTLISREEYKDRSPALTVIMNGTVLMHSSMNHGDTICCRMLPYTRTDEISIKSTIDRSIVFSQRQLSRTRECNPGTRVPQNPGKLRRFKTRKPGFESGQNPGLRV